MIVAVRNESVRLSLEDAGFSTGMARAAAVTALLNKELDDVDGHSIDTSRSFDNAAGSAKELSRETAIADERARGLSQSLHDEAGAAAHAERGIKGTADATKELTLEQAVAKERASRFSKDLRDQARAAVDAEQGISRISSSTKVYSRETAIADERASRFKKSLRDEARAAVDAEMGINRISTSARNGARDLDSYTTRLGLLVKTGLAVGPALAPISVAAVAGLAAISAQAGYAVTGIASVVVAFRGVGDAVKAVEKARLDPTVHNLELARRALQQLGPDAQEFVQHFAELRPVLRELRDSAASGFFPGMISALDDFEHLAPKLEQILHAVAQASGEVVRDAADSLDSPRWAEFLDFLQREAPPAITALGHTVGSLAHGLAELWMAFDPVNDNFLDWMTQAANSFDQWAGGLSKTQGFQEFLQYLHDTGPQLGEALGAVSNAILQIVEAASPLGGPVLGAITAIADAIAAVADSPLGTPIMAGVTALSALSLAGSAAAAAVGRLDAALVAMGIAGKTGGAEAAAGVASVGIAAGAATTGVVAEGAAVGGTSKKGGVAGALGLGSAKGNIVALSAFIGADAAVHLTDNFVKVLTGDRSLKEASDAVNKWSNPITAALATFGVDGPSWLPGGGGDMVYMGFHDFYTGVQDEIEAAQRAFGQTTHDIGLTDIATGHFAGTTLSTVGAIDRQIKAMDRLDKAALRQEKQAARADKIWQRGADAIRAQRSALSDAAAGFVDFGHQAKASEFTLDGWFDKLEGQTDAMRNFRENAFKAAEKGLGEGFIEHLRTMGPEGALQLKRLANAGSAAIDRANQDWRSYRREVRLAGSDTELLRLKLIDLGHSSASPKVKPKGLDDALVNTRIVQAQIDALGHTSVAPLIRERGSKKVIDAAAAARREVEAIPNRSETAIHQTGGKQVVDAANAARAAVSNIPPTHKTKIQEDGAAELAAAAARARAAVTNIPTSWHTTITVSHVGSLWSSGGYTGDGGKYEPRGIVHAGEVVIPQEDVQRDWSMLKSRYGHLPGFDSGGLVGNTPSKTKGDDSLSREAREAAKQLKHLRSEAKAATEALSKEREQRDAVIDKMKQLGTDVKDGLRSDLFGEQDVWAGDKSGSGILRGDIRNAHAEIQAIRELKKKGLSGPALAEVLSQGGLAGAQAYAQMSRAELAEFERLFNLRSRVLRSAGSLAGDAAFGPQLARERRDVREALKTLRRIEAAIKHAEKASHKNHKDDRTAQQKGAGSARRSSSNSRKAWV